MESEREMTGCYNQDIGMLLSLLLGANSPVVFAGHAAQIVGFKLVQIMMHSQRCRVE